jgi:hypothetical protein
VLGYNRILDERKSGKGKRPDTSLRPNLNVDKSRKVESEWEEVDSKTVLVACLGIVVIVDSILIVVGNRDVVAKQRLPGRSTGGHQAQA